MIGNKKLVDICVDEKVSIKSVLSIMASNKVRLTFLPTGVILVVDKVGELLGIATDGDIRRALARGVTMDAPISDIVNKSPFLIEGPKNATEILSLVVDKIRKESWHKDRLNKIIIVDEKRRPIDLVSFYDLWQKSDVRFKQIGIVGLGYVGLTLALTLADLGFKVKGYDVNSEVLKKIKSGQPHFFENGLESLLKDNLGKNFDVVSDFEKQNKCDIYFIAVGTPLDKNKKPDLSFIKNASEKVARVLKGGDAVILRSTVPVGTTRSVAVPILERHSKLKAGDDFFVAFAPERTVEGKALEELRQLPQVIGGMNWASADLASNIFSHMTHSVVLVDSLEEAEMVKLINNTYRDVVFAFANELSLVCKSFGINTRRVIEAANRGYNRSNVPMPSPGVGGACLEKDPFIFLESAKSKGYEPKLVKHSRAISDLMVDAVSGDILGFLQNKKSKKTSVLIMGLAFKGRPVTSDIRGSTSVSLLKKIKSKVGEIRVFDPAVSPADIAAYGARNISNLKDGFKSVDAVVVMTNHPDFESIRIRSMLGLANKPCLLLDCWGLYSKEDVEKEKGVKYQSL